MSILQLTKLTAAILLLIKGWLFVLYVMFLPCSYPLSPSLKTIKLKAEARLDLLRQVGVAVDTWLKSAMNQVREYLCVCVFRILCMCNPPLHSLSACFRWWRSWRMNVGPATLPTIPRCRWDCFLAKLADLDLSGSSPVLRKMSLN